MLGFSSCRLGFSRLFKAVASPLSSDCLIGAAGRGRHPSTVVHRHVGTMLAAGLMKTASANE